MDLQSFMTVLLYEYEWFLCVCTFTLLLCFIFEAILHWIHCFAISMGVCITAYYLYLHFQELSELAAQDERDWAAIRTHLHTLTLEFTCVTIVNMWSDLWLRYRTAPVHPLNERGFFIPWYRGHVHYSRPMTHMSLHIPSPDTRWALPYCYHMMPGHDGRVEQIGEDHDYLPLERIDPPVTHSYPPLDVRAQQLWDELLERSELDAERRRLE